MASQSISPKLMGSFGPPVITFKSFIAVTNHLVLGDSIYGTFYAPKRERGKREGKRGRERERQGERDSHSERGRDCVWERESESESESKIERESVCERDWL